MTTQQPLWRIRRTAPGLWHVERHLNWPRLALAAWVPLHPFNSGAEAIAAFAAPADHHYPVKGKT